MHAASDRLRYLYGLGGLADVPFTGNTAVAPEQVWNPPVAAVGLDPALSTDPAFQERNIAYSEPYYIEAEAWYKQPKWWAVGAAVGVSLFLIVRMK